MRLPGFITNKYTISALIVSGLLLIDIWLHRGESRVMLPDRFASVLPVFEGRPLNSGWPFPEKKWLKGINSVEQADAVPANCPGIEMDLYFDTAQGHFYVYHDSARISDLIPDSILVRLKKRGISCGFWMDLKNLDSLNQPAALAEMMRLRSQYQLSGPHIAESSLPDLLPRMRDSGFYTSYYIPYFNPYLDEEEIVQQKIQEISKALQQNPVHALSGYYFQYPILRKLFPRYPVLTWAEGDRYSAVSYFFRRMLDADTMVRVVLFPPET